MLRIIDEILHKVTMYKAVLWGLWVLAAIAILFSATGVLDLPLKGMLLSLGLLSLTCYTANFVFSKIWQVPTNTESYAITLLILFLILPQANTEIRALEIVLAGIIAIASKFIITSGGKHIFNPAAFAPFLLGLLGLVQASWWVGSSVLFPFALVIGLLLVRKIRRFSLFLSFAGVALAVGSLATLAAGDGFGETLRFIVLSSPLLFLGTIMLTDPATMPARRTQQIIFGSLVGFLYAMPWNIGPLTVYPETALILGNLYVFAVNPRYRLRLKLKEIQQVSDRVYNYIFTPDRKATYLPGQHMEFTLDHRKQDSRGNRRTFSFASSPTEDDIQLGVKYFEPSSSFKKALKVMKPGDILYAGQTAGDFILPPDQSQKLMFIAAGIGVTPFRGMLKYLQDRQEKRDIVMIYAVSDAEEIAYSDILEQAENSGARIIGLLRSDTPPVWWEGHVGRLDATFIIRQIPDYKDRKIYLSGPYNTVQNVRADLISSGISRKKIKTDYFTGY